MKVFIVFFKRFIDRKASVAKHLYGYDALSDELKMFSDGKWFGKTCEGTIKKVFIKKGNWSDRPP